MKRTCSSILFVLLILIPGGSFGQSKKSKFGDPSFYLIDSLRVDELGKGDKELLKNYLTRYHKATADTTKVRCLDTIIENMIDDHWVEYNLFAKNFVEKILEENPDVPGKNIFLYMKASSIGNIGYTQLMHGDLPHALDNFSISLSMAEKIGDTPLIASNVNNIGYIYNLEGNTDMAFKYYKRSLDLNKKIGNQHGLATAYNNLAAIYRSKDSLDKALEYYQKSVDIDREAERVTGMATALNNISFVYTQKKEYDKALDYANQSLKICKETKNRRGLIYCYQSLGQIYMELEEYEKAKKYLTMGYELAVETRNPRAISGLSSVLYQYYEKMNQPKEALDMYKRHIKTRDSLKNEEHNKHLYKTEIKHEYEKQKALDKKENEKKLAIEREVEHRQQLVIYFVAILAIGLIVFLAFVFSRLKQSRRQNRIIEEQKIQVEEAYEELNQTNEEILAQRDQIEEQREILSIQNETLAAKNVQIMDGINYARNIQENLLINKDDVKHYFKNSFVLHLPKDMVSGDFYWIRKRDGKVYMAVADCTGHGVSAALLSIVCSRLLDKAADRHAFDDAGKMLDYLHTQVLKQLKRANETVDGMDISLCIFDHKENKFQFSGAHNAAVVIRKKEIIRLEADNRPIGFTYKNKEYRDFSNTTFEYQEGDSLYLFSDGYYDQFGGPKNTKLYAARFDELLAKTAQMDIEKQRAYLEKYFSSWKGYKEQIDDVCIVGVRL